MGGGVEEKIQTVTCKFEKSYRKKVAKVSTADITAQCLRIQEAEQLHTND